ncbi:hypothetical protein ACFFIX_00990 [Metabacillus herbersteinensis]|uniref:DUF4401 domain-containing protein n=1 Tax=Metabacillus herbersteinensis TaxID=283816 RepID=A0ABV6G8N0_9BACI
MNIDRKTVIIEEIQQWKKTKMLPETYCDFLLALYTEGNQVQEEKQLAKNRPANLIGSVLALLLLPSALLVIYFTELSFLLQMGIVSFFLLLSIVLTILLFKNNYFYHLSVCISSVLLLIMSVYFVEETSKENSLLMGFTLLLNCLLWIYLSKKLRLIYLFISGIVGMVFFIAITLY